MEVLRCMPCSSHHALLGRTWAPRGAGRAPTHRHCSQQPAAWRHSGQPASSSPAATEPKQQLLDPGSVAPPARRRPQASWLQQQQHVEEQAHQSQQLVQQQAQAAPAPSRTGFMSGLNLGRVKRRLLRSLRSPYDHAIWSLAAPAVLALAADPLLGMVDTAFVGRLGQEHLGALGVNTSLFAFAFVVFNFLTTATTPMVAAAVAAKDTRQAGEVTWQAGTLALVLGSGVTVLLLANADSALLLMGLDAGQPQMMSLAKEYLVVRAAAAPAALLVTVGQGVFRGLQNMRVPLMVTVGTNVIHLALGPLFIFKLGMGLEGAALSTAAAEWLAAIWYVRLVWQERDQLGLWPPPQIDMASAKERYLPFLQAGSAVLLRTGVLLGTKTMATAVATRLGASSVASHQVLMQLWILASMVVDSLAVSGQTLVAVALGRNARAEARRLSQRLLGLGLGLGVGLAVLLGATSPWWPGLFTDDQEVLGHINALLPLALAPLPINALVYTLDGVLVGASDFGYMMSAMVGASAIAASVLALVLPMGWGLEGVWASMALLMSARLATLVARFQSEQGPLPPSSLALPSSSSSGENVLGDVGNADGSSVSANVTTPVVACDSAESSCEVDEGSRVVEAALQEAEVTMHQHNLGIVASGHEEAALMSHVPVHTANGQQQEQPLQPVAQPGHIGGSINDTSSSSSPVSNAVPGRLSRGSVRRSGRMVKPQHRKVHNGFESDVAAPFEQRVVALTSVDDRES